MTEIFDPFSDLAQIARALELARDRLVRVATWREEYNETLIGYAADMMALIKLRRQQWVTVNGWRPYGRK